MTISNDLFMAILAMDSYNRGYNPGLNIVGNQIGNASIGLAKGDQEAVAASFFAQAYTWNTKTVISYRGTDVLPGGDNPFYNPSSYVDIAGWSTAIGGSYST
jgi:hypothetical protein